MFYKVLKRLRVIEVVSSYDSLSHFLTLTMKTSYLFIFVLLCSTYKVKEIKKETICCLVTMCLLLEEIDNKIIYTVQKETS